MGEIDTKAIESVQASLALFGGKNGRTKDRTTISNELERDEELEGLLKGLSKLKVQIEAKEFANKQAILKIDQYEKQTNELSNLLKNSEIEKEIFMNECQEAQTRVHELESKINEMTDQLVNQELLRMEADSADSENMKNEALRHARSLETELKMEKEKNKELLECVSKLNEAIVHLKIGGDEGDKEMYTILSEKKDELNVKTRNAEVKLDDTRKELEMNKTEIEMQTKTNSDQSDYIELMEMQSVQLRLRLKNANEEEKHLYPDFEHVKIELEKLKMELEDIRKRETEAQVEIAILKSEIQKGQSTIAEGEAVQERLNSENSSLYIAVKQLGLEVEETKNENKILRKTECKAADEDDETSNYVKISKQEYQALTEKAGKGKQCEKLETLKSDLENANAKIAELRARAEQAASRAEVAEKEKAKLEDRITRWRERKERRKKAIAGLQEEIIPEECTVYNFGQGASSSKGHKTYQPLGKILNMKF